MSVESQTSSYLVLTSSHLVRDDVWTRVVRTSSPESPLGVPGRGFGNLVPGEGRSEKNTPPAGTRFECVKCGTEVPPSDLLCRACFEARRPPVCQSCGGRLVAGKCGWC